MSANVACLLLTALLPLADGRPAQPQLKKEFAPLQGTWKVVSVESGGETFPIPDKPPRWIIRGDKVLYAGKELARLALDNSTKPRSIDLAFLAPKRVYEGVYQVGGDTLKICVNRQTDGVKERPLGFATKDKPNLRLLVFERQKDATDDPAGFVGMQIGYSKDRKEIVITQALENSPAKKAGLKKDDVLVSVGGAQLTDLRGVVAQVRQQKPGNKLVLRVRRDGKEKDITINVGIAPFYLLD